MKRESTAIRKPIDPGEALEAALEARYGPGREQRELIATALVFWRRGEEATARLDGEGLTVQAGKGVYRHPLVGVERQARLGFAAILETLEKGTRRRKIGAPTKPQRMAADPQTTRAARRYLRAQ